MKAIRVNEFGGPEVLQLNEVPVPVPAADELLIRMYASSVNPADYIIRSGGNELLRPFLRLPLGLGLDAAGVVEATGSDVTGFKAGDRVYGVPNFPGDGAYAEYIAAKAVQFSLIPSGYTLNEAGSLPSCALIAWNGIEDMGHVQKAQRVLVHGAAGGVGSLAIQFAKAKGARVTGTASPYNFQFLKDLGADEVLDYKDQQFTGLDNTFDVVFNASPVRDNAVNLRSAGLLKTGGIFVDTQLDNPFSEELKAALMEKGATGTHVGGGSMTYTSSLKEITAFINANPVRAVIGKIYPLDGVAQAHRDSESKHVSGKIVLEIRKEEE